MRIDIIPSEQIEIILNPETDFNKKRREVDIKITKKNTPLINVKNP